MNGIRKWWNENIVGDAPSDMGRTSVLDLRDTRTAPVTDDDLAMLSATLDPAGVGVWTA